MPAPVDITLTVTRFVPNSSSTHPAKDRPQETCEIAEKIALKGITERDWQRDVSGQVFICPPPDVGVIAVKKLGADPVAITFKIASGPGVPALQPTAIFFEQQKFRDDPNRPLGDGDGRDNFETISVAADALTVVDRWRLHGRSKDRSRHEAPIWKFWIRVVATGAGAAQHGWIDPTIENSEDMAV